MGVEVSEDDRVARSEVEEIIEVGRILRLARRRRWDVDVDNDEFAMSKVNTNGEGFQVRIVGEERIHVKRHILNALMNEDGQAATASIPWAILADKRVPRERRTARGRAELGLLQARDLDVVLMQERRELALRRVDPVDVELKDARNCLLRRRTRTRRTGIRVETGDEEEEDDEEARERS